KTSSKRLRDQPILRLWNVSCSLAINMPVADFEQFKIHDASSYDAVAAAFDLFTRRFTPPIARRLCSLAGLKPGTAVLDIGTGTGIVALEAAPHVAPGGRIIGIDLSQGMLAIARKHAAVFRDSVEFREMDAERLAFPDSFFDSVVSLFALLHFPDPLGALREIRRVLRPGGSLAIAVGSRPPLSLAGMAHRIGRIPFYAEHLLGRVLIAPAFLDGLVLRHIPDGSAPEQTELAGRTRNRSAAVPQLLKQAGFRDVSLSWEGFEIALDSVEEFWELQCTYSSLARKRLASASAAQRKAIEAEFAARCGSVLARGGRLVYTYAALYAAARNGA
ncbi:MAG TPA: methyltransferase domain-containing protein, partial [Bryobacteraceae bacterium]|nr:methyltransferase domain-containing protein [Bryobacteraceae bacterium]